MISWGNLGDHIYIATLMSNFDPSVLPSSVLPAHEEIARALSIPASAKALAESEVFRAAARINAAMPRGGPVSEELRQALAEIRSFQVSWGMKFASAQAISKEIKRLTQGFTFPNTAQTKILKLPSLKLTQRVLDAMQPGDWDQLREIASSAAVRLPTNARLAERDRSPDPGAIRVDAIFQQVMQADRSFPDPMTIVEQPPSSAASDTALAATQAALQYVAPDLGSLARVIHESLKVVGTVTVGVVLSVIGSIIYAWLLHHYPWLGPSEKAVDHTFVAAPGVTHSPELLHSIRCDAGTDAPFLRLTKRDQVAMQNPKSGSIETGYIPASSVVCVQEVTKDWTKVTWRQGGEVYAGWVYSRYLRKITALK